MNHKLYQRILEAFDKKRGVNLSAEEVQVLAGNHLTTFEAECLEPDEGRDDD